MGSITGTYYHSVDPKGRLSLPSKLREQLGDSFWVSRGLTGKFLSLLPEEAWEEYTAQFAELKGREGERVRRSIYAGSAQVTQDKQGRVLVRADLLQFAEIDKDVVILGVGKKAELWSAKNWADEDESFDPSTAAVLESLIL